MIGRGTRSSVASPVPAPDLPFCRDGIGAIEETTLADDKMIDARDATEEMADLKRRIKVTRPALQAVRRKPKAENDQS